MQIILNVPKELPDALQCSPEEFTVQAKFAMAAKLYETGKISSGMAAQLSGISRRDFLVKLSETGVAVHNLSAGELQEDLGNV